MRLGVEPAPGGPAHRRVPVANAGRRYVADRGVCEWTQHFAKVARARRMIRVELTDDIVILVTVVVVEEGEVPLLAPGASRPGEAMVIIASLSGGDADAATLAPGDRFRRGVFVGEPGVVRVVLRQHAFERLGDDGERLGRRLRDHHGDSRVSGDAQRARRFQASIEDDDEVERQQRRPGEKRGKDDKRRRPDVMFGLEPPRPKKRQCREP